MKIKKIVLGIILIIILSFSACAQQQQYDPETDFEATPVDGGKSVMITKYIGSKFEVRIPPRIQGLPVTHIGSRIFINNSLFNDKIISVTIPNSVTTIVGRAFENCINLTRITIPSSVTSIGVQPFFGCYSLSEININASNGAYTIENGILYSKDKTLLHSYPNIKTDDSFVIPNTVTTIGAFAFESCFDLTSITIPNSVTTIEWQAFANCANLTNITIPNSVTSIGGRAFANCASFTSITIPTSVIIIGWEAFESCFNLTNIIIPDSVATIEDGAFRYCQGLTDIIIPNSVTTIGAGAFSGTSLTSITIPNSITAIEEETFSGTNLTSITIPSSVTSIGDRAFSACSSLTSVTFEGTIALANFMNSFDGDLTVKYLTSQDKLGTYTRTAGRYVWTKQ